MADTPKAESEYGVRFGCLLCPATAPYTCCTAADLFAHAAEAHAVSEGEARATTGKMAQHLDTRDWSESTYQFMLADGRLFCIKSVRLERQGEDRIWWSDPK